MYTYKKIEDILRQMLQPVHPRSAYVQALKRRLLAGRRMKVEVETDHTVRETITLATVGLGAIATVAALTTLGVQLIHYSANARARHAGQQPSIGHN
jgi:hypothetical protein